MALLAMRRPVLTCVRYPLCTTRMGPPRLDIANLIERFTLLYVLRRHHSMRGPDWSS